MLGSTRGPCHVPRLNGACNRALSQTRYYANPLITNREVNLCLSVCFSFSHSFSFSRSFCLSFLRYGSPPPPPLPPLHLSRFFVSTRPSNRRVPPATVRGSQLPRYDARRLRVEASSTSHEHEDEDSIRRMIPCSFRAPEAPP